MHVQDIQHVFINLSWITTYDRACRAEQPAYEPPVESNNVEEIKTATALITQCLTADGAAAHGRSC